MFCTMVEAPRNKPDAPEPRKALLKRRGCDGAVARPLKIVANPKELELRAHGVLVGPVVLQENALLLGGACKHAF